MAWENNTFNTGLYADPANGGVGFTVWESTKDNSPQCGYFLGSSMSAANLFDSVRANINSALSNESFAMYAHKNNNPSAPSIFSLADRTLNDPLTTVGDFFQVKYTWNYRNGYKKLYFLNGANAGNFTVQAASDQYQIAPNESNNFVNMALLSGSAPWGVYKSNSVWTLRADRTSTDTTTIRVIRENSDSTVDTFLTAMKIDVFSLRIAIGNTDNSDTQNNIYFNFLSAYNPYY